MKPDLTDNKHVHIAYINFLHLKGSRKSKIRIIKIGKEIFETNKQKDA